MEYFSDGELKRIRELSPIDEDVDTRIIQGLIVGMSDIEHYEKIIVTKCVNCHDENIYINEGNFRNFLYAIKCKKCKIDCKIIQNTKSMIRKILLQEIDSTTPMDITTFLFGEDTLLAEAGKKVSVRGALRSVKRNTKDLTYQRVFDVNKINVGQRKIKLPTEEEIEKFKSLTKQDIIDSFAPRIMGMNEIKESLIIACIGGNEITDVRGDINIFLVGDPGTGKTQLLRFVAKIRDPSAYASGKSSSAAGLLAGVDNLSDGTRIARAGPVVLCNGGLVAIDEMDKMNANDRSALHEAMESQSFALLKIGINRTWPCMTVIIGAANPHGGNSWNPSLSIKENVRLPDSLLSRFGLIFLIRDIPDPDRDLEIAKHIMNVRQGIIQPKLNEEELKVFINYVKTFHPTPTVEASQLLTKWWSDLRQEKQKVESINVDRRVLEDMGRMSEAYAKWRFSDKVEVQDAENAILLLKESLKSLGMNTPGERNQSLGESMNKEEFIRFLFEQPITEDMAVVKLITRLKWSKEKAQIEIQKLRTLSLITENDGMYSWVN